MTMTATSALKLDSSPALSTTRGAISATGRALRFVRRGEIVQVDGVLPSRTLLELVREDLGCSGTKEGCNEGDCGACTVVLGEKTAAGTLQYRAVNSCIRLAHSIDGMALWTVEDIAAPSPASQLHPAQQAMLQCHASQCGFCTPGFVMSLFALHQQQRQHRSSAPISRSLAQEALSGNLCRCTGYRPILEAATTMQSLPDVPIDEKSVLSKCELLVQVNIGLEADLAYKKPLFLADLLVFRAAHPDAQMVAGCTDVGLWINKQHRIFEHIIDVTRVHELRQIHCADGTLRIGAAVPLADAYAALVEQWPQLAVFASRFAGLPVRNSGTLGGNVANGSPIGDSMPLLIALKANVVLASHSRGQRSLPLEALYTGYRTNVMAADEVLAFIDLPLPTLAHAAPGLQIYKISKRFDDDISAVCLAIAVRVLDGLVQSASIGVGGVAATPVRALQTEAALQGQPWTLETVQLAQTILRAEFSPISDMRASSDYRRTVLGNLLQRYWLQSQGVPAIDLADAQWEALA